MPDKYSLAERYKPLRKYAFHDVQNRGFTADISA
jgi:hypothetical protein